MKICVDLRAEVLYTTSITIKKGTAMSEPKDCSYCKRLMPCKAETKSQDMTPCDKFEDFFPENDGITSLEELQAINASIPDDEFLPDYSGIEEEQPISIEVGGIKMEVER